MVASVFGASASRTTPLDRATLDRALEAGNVPVLISVLAHLTEDDRWLREPFTPTRTRGLSDHGDGGLDTEVQQRVRDAVADLLTSGDPVSVPPISDERLAAIMSNCMGEDVPPAYAELMREEMGFADRFPQPKAQRRHDRAVDHTVLVIGAGVSGLCMAVQLQRAGIDFTVVEKNPDVGGTWFENRYPDCGVDTPSYWYSYSFFPSNWDRYYSKRDDVHAYFARAADHFGLRDRIRFETKVESAVFDESSATWTVALRDADGARHDVTTRYLVSAVGQLNQPKTPTIPGAENFAGRQFHSAQWPEDVDLAGARVAVVGTGASAMQFVPVIADEVAELTIFQRSPQWIAPNEEYEREVEAGVHYLMDHVPGYAAWYRMRQVWSFGDKIHQSLHIDPQWRDRPEAINEVNDAYRRYFTRYITEKLGDRSDLLDKVLPDYPPFGKRMLLDNGWLDALLAPNVALVTEGVSEVRADSVVAADGTEYAADVIIYATGFDSLNMLSSFDVLGREGRSLRQQWGADDARAYLGMTERGFPNLFFLYGPNTNLGHGGSLIFIAECQVRYVVDLIDKAIDKGVTALECRADLRDEHNRAIDEAHEHLIWTHPGMSTWYRNAAGRVVTNSPWTLLGLWEMTRSADLDDYEVR